VQYDVLFRKGDSSQTKYTIFRDNQWLNPSTASSNAQLDIHIIG